MHIYPRKLMWNLSRKEKINPTSGAYCPLEAVSGFVHPIYSRNLRVAWFVQWYYFTYHYYKKQVEVMGKQLSYLGWPRGMGWRRRWEWGSGWGKHVNPWLIHVNVWQKSLQYCKVISLQLIKIPAQVGCMRQVLGPSALGRPRGIG